MLLVNKLKDYNIILASGSPRRQQFLKDLNLKFTSNPRKISEVFPKNLKGSQITDYLAELKSKAFENDINENDLIITADTIVWLNDNALGKPTDKIAAVKMLRRLSGKTHQVITSVCIMTSKEKKIFHDVTDVSFRELLDDEIEYYIENYQPFDKAGSYGIQEWIGKIGVIQLKGCYFNVMGLPVNKLYSELLNLSK